jgi:hypothetical protein
MPGISNLAGLNLTTYDIIGGTDDSVDGTTLLDSIIGQDINSNTIKIDQGIANTTRTFTTNAEIVGVLGSIIQFNVSDIIMPPGQSINVGQMM